MIHIAPWSACLALLDGAAAALAPGAPLVLYGPYREGGAHTAPSNAAFDASLRERDPRWGVRDQDEVAAEAAARGLDLEEVVAMPANNRILVLRRRNTGRARGSRVGWARQASRSEAQPSGGHQSGDDARGAGARPRPDQPSRRSRGPSRGPAKSCSRSARAGSAAPTSTGTTAR